MSFEVKKFDVEYNLPVIKYDLSDLRENIEKVKEEYGDFVVTEDNISVSKKVKAQLGKLEKAISRKRIDIVKKIKEPITKFEDEIKLLTVDLNELTNKIKDQISVFDEKQKEEKKQEIISDELWADYMIFNDKWLNKSYKMADIKKELEAQKLNFTNNSLLITTTCENLGLNSLKYLEMLKNKKEIQDIIVLINNDKEVKSEYSTQPDVEAIVEDIEEKIEEAQDQTKISYTLKLKGTTTQLRALKQFIVDNGIEYEKIE